MRQIVSLVKDNQVHFALVDDDSGEMIPFADVMIPDPDRFGLHEAAVLGTNLINALSLDGRKPRKHEPVSERPVVPAAETAAERKRRRAREHYHANKDRRSDARTKNYIPMERVIEVVNEHGQNGLTSREVAALIDGSTPDTVEKWVTRTVDNRITAMRTRAERGIPLPVRIEYDESRSHNGNPGRVLKPLIASPKR